MGNEVKPTKQAQELFESIYGREPALNKLEYQTRRDFFILGWEQALAARSDSQGEGGSTVGDYLEVIEDYRRVTREIDVIINGKDAAKQAALIDLIPQVRALSTLREENERLREGTKEIHRLTINSEFVPNAKHLDGEQALIILRQVARLSRPDKEVKG